jgi:adenosylmethionine-8-amino-7-oxononanoate aminotransferase
VIGREPSYHGATLGALAVTGDHHAEDIFDPLMRSMPKVPAPLSYRVPAGHTVESYAEACARALEDEIVRQGPDTVLAFIMEPVGGLASGAMVAPASYYDAVRAICDRHGVLLIYDEVMSGAGRTGTFLAADHWPAVRPDLVTLPRAWPPATRRSAPSWLGPHRRSRRRSRWLPARAHVFHQPVVVRHRHAVVSEMLDRDLIGNAARMGRRLRPGLERAVFVSGGSEATEAAIKLARQYALAVGEPDRADAAAGAGRARPARRPRARGRTGALLAADEPREVRRLGDDHAAADHRCDAGR